MHEQGGGAAPGRTPLAETLADLHIERCFGTEEDRLGFLREMSLEQFHRTLSWANFHIRGIPEQEQGYSDLSDVNMVVDDQGRVDYVGPRGVDRINLMERGFAAAQHSDDPVSAGAILALTIANARPFPESNDKTAHLAFALLSRGYDGSDADKEHYVQLLNGQDQSILATSNIAGLPHRFVAKRTHGVANYYGASNYTPMGVVNVFPRHDGIHSLESDDPRRSLMAMADEPVFNRVVLTEFITASGRNLADFLVERPHVEPQLMEETTLPETFNGLSGNYYLDTSRLIYDMNPDEAPLMWEVYNQIKYAYVKSIIDCFEGDTSIHGDWRVILAYFHRLKGDMPPSEPFPKNEFKSPGYDPILQAIKLVTETMGGGYVRPNDEDSEHPQY